MGVILKNAFALLRGNIKFALLKVFHWKSFCYNARSRVFNRVEITIRRKGKLSIGKNIKIGKNATLECYGGTMRIGKNVGIGDSNRLICLDSITIGDGTIFGPNVMLYDHDHIFDKNNGVDQRNFKTKPISIGKNVWIGANVIILRGTVIGDNCVIGAGSVLKGDFLPGTIITQRRENVIRELR